MAQTYPNHGRIDGPIVIIGFGSIGQGHAAADRAALHLRPAQGPRHRARPTSTAPSSSSAACTSSTTRVTPRELPRAARRSSSPTAAGSASTSRSTPARSTSCGSAASSASSTSTPWSSPGPGIISTSRSTRPTAPTTRCARRCGRRSGRTPAGRRRSAAAAPTRAWCRGCSRRRCCGSPPTLGRPAQAPRDRAGWARLMQGLGVKGVHIAERDTQAGRDAKPLGTLRQHLVGGGVRLRELPAGRARLGHATSAGSRRTATATPGGCKAAIYLDTPGPPHQGPHLDPGGAGRSTAFSSPTTRRSRSPTTTPSARATRRSSARPATMPTTPAARRCCRCTRCSAPGEVQERQKILDENEILWGED